MNQDHLITALNWIAKLSEFGQLTVSLLFAVTMVCSALSLLAGAVGAFWPPAMALAKRCSDIGLRLHGWGERLGKLLQRLPKSGAPLACALLLALGGLTLSGCAMTSAISSWFTSHEQQIVTDGEQLAAEDIECVIANAALGPAADAAACGLQAIPTVLDDIKKLIAGQVVAVRRMGMSHLEMRARASKDGGADASP